MSCKVCSCPLFVGAAIECGNCGHSSAEHHSTGKNDALGHVKAEAKEEGAPPIDVERFQQEIEEEFAGNEDKFSDAKQELEFLLYDQADNAEEIRRVLFNFLIVERMVRNFLRGKTGYTKGEDLTAFIEAATDLHNHLLETVASYKRVDFRPFMRGYRRLPTEERGEYISSIMDLIMSIREGIIFALPVSGNIKKAFRKLIDE
mmetsp:Transcript_6306/g.4746  ORF Transcript_6306/g.4746 Transcript_6306/m.4746 type:complete len:203 (+) Transcript_6306:20-628(+)